MGLVPRFRRIGRQSQSRPGSVRTSVVDEMAQKNRPTPNVESADLCSAGEERMPLPV